jgi:hypothetical protein
MSIATKHHSGALVVAMGSSASYELFGPASPSATAWRRRSPMIRTINSRASPPPMAARVFSLFWEFLRRGQSRRMNRMSANRAVFAGDFQGSQSEKIGLACQGVARGNQPGFAQMGYAMAVFAALRERGTGLPSREHRGNRPAFALRATARQPSHAARAKAGTGKNFERTVLPLSCPIQSMEVGVIGYERHGVATAEAAAADRDGAGRGLPSSRGGLSFRWSTNENGRPVWSARCRRRR